jgi:hypothetical protein
MAIRAQALIPQYQCGGLLVLEVAPCTALRIEQAHVGRANVDVVLYVSVTFFALGVTHTFEWLDVAG